jgi:hypothetical protein
MRKVCKNGPEGPAHMALSMSEFLASKQTTMLEHPPYLLNLAPSDFFLSEDERNIERKAF